MVITETHVSMNDFTTVYIMISTTYQMDIDAEDHELSDSESDQSIKKASRSGGCDTTDEEVALHLGIVIRPHIPKAEVPQVEVEDGVIDRTAIDYTLTMAPGPLTGNFQVAVNRHFKIIYIPDAAMRIRSKEKAQNNLGFIPTVLSELEYEPLKHLVGSIHVISKCRARHSNIVSFRVVMQEWVSASIK